MSSQLSPISTLPPLAPPEFKRHHSRLEEGLFRLVKLTAWEFGEAMEDLPTPAPQINSPRTETASDSGMERRAFPRREGHCRVAVCRLTEDDGPLSPQQIEWRLHATSLKGSLADLSLNGAAVLLEHPLPVGETVVIRLVCPRRDRHLDQQASIVRCLPDPSGECKVICEFSKRLSLEQVSFFSRILNQMDWL